MKKILFSMISISLVAFACVWIFTDRIERAGASAYSSQVYTNDPDGVNGTATTTDYVYKTSAMASSTINFDPQNGRYLNVFASVYSTSTPSTLEFKFQFSNNNSDWFDYRDVSTTTSLVRGLDNGGAGTRWTWVAATTTADETVKMVFPVITGYSAKYGRMLYSVLGGASNLHLEIAQQKEI